MNEKLAKKQLFCSRLAAAFTGVLLAAVLITGAIIVPKALTALDNVNGLAEEAKHTLERANTAMDNIDVMATEVAGDMNTLTEGFTAFMEDDVAKISEAVDMLGSIDVDSLNSSISTLKSSVNAFSNTLGMFGR